VVLTRGQGAYLWDESGKRYTDMMSAYSAVSLGHAHPELVATLAEQAGRLALVSRAYYTDQLSGMLERLTRLSGLPRALPVNTGLEAVETALKAARKWGHKVKGIPDGCAEIICCSGNFHGRSIAILAMSSEAQYRDGFGPFPGGFVQVRYGDADALKEAITPNTAAFLVEPIQGEAGIVVPPAGYLKRVAEICKRNNVLLIVDEVQTGLGRTGKLFCFEHEGIKPDGLCLGKALGGGLLPVSAFLAREDVMGVFNPGDHGSTFGGNPLAAAVACKALDLIVDGKLPERAAALGADFCKALRELDSPVVRQIRGMGLLIGVELHKRVSARAVAERLMQRGILTKETHGTVIRFAPPLVISETALDEATGIIGEVFDEFAGPKLKAA
jgi:ornithine--oxo-acid transaminase